MGNQIGTIAALWRYPVASLGGEQIESAEIDESGVVGDRGWGVFAAADDEPGVAPRGRKWGRMVRARARYAAPPAAGTAWPEVEVHFPDGSSLASDGAAVEAKLSALIGNEVLLRRIDGGRFVRGYDSSPLHVVTTASLDWLTQLYPEGAADVRRFRANLVIGTGAQSGFVENQWIGRTLRIGEVALRITEDCRRCAMTTLEQGDLPRDRGILQSVIEHNHQNMGIYADVATPGVVHHGDPVSLI